MSYSRDNTLYSFFSSSFCLQLFHRSLQLVNTLQGSISFVRDSVDVFCSCSLACHAFHIDAISLLIHVSERFSEV